MHLNLVKPGLPGCGADASPLDRMLVAAAAYKGKAGPANQPFIADKLSKAGFPMDQITDWLPHLMYHLGAPEETL